jgi:PEP-CTERM motif-containing protein
MKLSTAAIFMLASCLAASAATITYDTAPGSTTLGGAVDATATFVTNNDETLTITLTDLLANPTDVAQLISDISFTLSNSEGTGSILSSSGQDITVNSNGTFTTGSTVDTGWGLTASMSGFHLDVLGTKTAPTHLIIGPPDGSNLYSNANGSIAGNPPHNPFLNGTATFTLEIPGISADTTVTSATFSFGTDEGANLVPGTPRNQPTVPEPGTYVMMAVGLGLVGLAQLRRKAKATR